MAELINRLKIDKFTSDELMYHSSNYELLSSNNELEMQVFQTQERETKLQNELKAEREQRQQREAEVKAEREKRHIDLLKGIKKLLNRGETIDAIAEFYELSVNEITILVKEIEDKER
jgi:diphthamide synthase subunit DPH2